MTIEGVAPSAAGLANSPSVTSPVCVPPTVPVLLLLTAAYNTLHGPAASAATLPNVPEVPE